MSTVSVTPRRVAYTCPNCLMLVHLDVQCRPTEQGFLVVDDERLRFALSLHIRVGCSQ